MEKSDSANARTKRKVLRKQARCKSILKKHEGLDAVDYPTKCLFVGNGGLVCGIQRESLMDLFKLYGVIEDIIMVPDKSYSFVVYNNVASSEQAMANVNGKKLRPDCDSVLYLCYINEVPQQWLPKHELPKGLVLIRDFVSEEEEQLLLSSVRFDDDKGIMKHRKVKHFGYEFNYSTNNVDVNKPLEEKIPEVFHPFLQKLEDLGYISEIPDQLTVNHYLPGHGIPPHIDTHSAFKDAIISLSLGSQVVMDFYSPDNRHVPVVLPRRSALIMKGESRYIWKHGITPRKTDVVPVFSKDSCYLTLSYRLPRTSFTFRVVNKGPCQCEFKDQCDSQAGKLNTASSHTLTEMQAKQLESQYVTKVYDTIADHFSETRYKPWPRVADFINSVPPGSILIDAGCGNGKNMGGDSNCYKVGCDISVKLAEVCAKRKLQVVVGDVMDLPFRDACADVCVCIAVIHHIATKSRRSHAVKEIVRILKPGGTALIYVWAWEQEGPNGPSNYLKHSKIVRKDSERKSVDITSVTKTVNTPSSLSITVHENRTQFQDQDLLVPWHKIKSKQQSTDEGDGLYHRYYHVFVEGELDSLVRESGIEILSSYYDKGNWCMHFKKPEGSKES